MDEKYKGKIDLNFPSLVTIGTYQNNERIGEFRLNFNCLDDLTHSEFKEEKELEPKVENKLSLMSIEFIFLINHDNINDVINIINEKEQLADINVVLKLD